VRSSCGICKFNCVRVLPDLPFPSVCAILLSMDMILPKLVNYLHYGDALESLSLSLLAEISASHISKRELISRLISDRRISSYAHEVVQVYRTSNANSKYIDMNRFRLDIERSITYRRLFNSLGCRGFSFELAAGFDFVDPLREDLDLRFLLLARSNLFYPVKIRKYMSQVKNVHYKEGGFPAIAFALGKRISGNWFIFALQSDLMFRCSYIRSYVRGWQRILLSILKREAEQECASLYLVRSCDVFAGCYPVKFRPPVIPPVWREIYDGAAAYFDAKLAYLPKPLDINVLSLGQENLTPAFYRIGGIR
jgi:hypothetical protein